MNRRLKLVGAAAFVAVLGMLGSASRLASNQLLFPSWKGATSVR